MLLIATAFSFICGALLARLPKKRYLVLSIVLWLFVVALNVASEHFEEIKAACLLIFGKGNYLSFVETMHELLHTDSLAELTRYMAALWSLITLCLSVLLIILLTVFHAVIGNDTDDMAMGNPSFTDYASHTGRKVSFRKLYLQYQRYLS